MIAELTPQQYADPERKDLPSGSNMGSYQLCPGKFLAEKGMPDIPNEYSEAGDKMHLAWEKDDPSGLDEEEVELLSAAWQQREKLQADWQQQFAIPSESLDRKREYREWVTGKDGVEIFSVKMDERWIAPEQRLALVIDLKTGREPAPPPSDNWQLRTGAVALYMNHPIIHCRTAIIQPWCKTQPPCDYDLESLRRSARLIAETVTKITKPNQPRTPGEVQCRWCKAKATCPEANTEMLTIQPVQSWPTIPPERKLELWDAAHRAEKIAADIKALVRADVVKGLIPGLRMKPGASVREITDLAGVYGLLVGEIGENLKPSEFAAACSMKLKALADLYRKHTGCTKKAADDWITDKAGDFLTLKQKAGTIERIKS